jgi:UDP-N-acetylglucosamine 4,6-dehydratase
MKVLITGGAGFLGRGILRRVQRGNLDWEITCYSRDETKQDEARQQWPQARFILGDVRDTELLTAAAMGHDAVIHAAALKYIDKAELNAAECLSVNVGGAQAVVRAARAAGVAKVVGISTDKAVQPVNVYGCSKMAMERLFAESSGATSSFFCVRYGNVIGSTGSVIPFFQQQAEKLGKVTLTDPNMTRFWMGVDEAIDLIALVLAGKLQPGSIAIPEVQAMKMDDVVKAAVGENAPVEIIGTRPGEKMHERLLHFEESVRVLRQQGWLELLPPGIILGATKPSTIVSNNPHHWMTVDRMRELIEDAKELQL